MRRKRKSYKGKITALVVIALVVVAAIVAYQIIRNTNSGANKVLLVTSVGNITIQLYDDMPITTGNFKNLVSRGIYDGTIFHRVVRNFVIQGGDPTLTGHGDLSIPSIQDELPNRHSNIEGAVAMAKTKQPNSATSQFFINLKDNSANLDTDYSVFGMVIEGMDVVHAIGNLQTDSKEKPLQEVTVIKAELAN